MSTATIIITVILGVAGLSAGLVFGFLPMDTRKMTQSHQRLSTILGTVSMGGVIILNFHQSEYRFMGTDWGAPCRVHLRRYPCSPFPGCQAVPLLPASGRTSACAQAAKKQINRGTGLQEPQTAAEAVPSAAAVRAIGGLLLSGC